MPESRRVYTSEFKVAAVKLVTEQGRSVAEAARSLGISDKILRQWQKALASKGSDAFPGQGHPPAAEAELRRLQEENKRLRMEDWPLKFSFPLKGVRGQTTPAEPGARVTKGTRHNGGPALST